MAWGHKAERIRQLEILLAGTEDRVKSYRTELFVAQDEAAAARRENDRLKRKADELEKVKKAANDEAAARRVELREAKARQLELEWAVHLLNRVLARTTGTKISTPLSNIKESTVEVAREAVRERDIVVKWDDLAGTPEIHFPKKDQRRAPWAPGGMYMVPGAVELIYDLGIPIGNPA